MAEAHSARVVFEGDASSLIRAAQQAMGAMDGLVASTKSVQSASDKLTDTTKRNALSIEKLRSSAVGMFGVLAGGVVAVDKIVMAQGRYSALVQNLPFSIDAATKATQGYIGKSKLMDTALQANRAGLIKGSEAFAQFAGDVQKVAATRGQDATEAMEVLTRALARNETELLDNYGIILKVSQAQEIYAEQLGKTKNTLTATEKAQAFGAIGMQKIHDIAEKSNVELDEHVELWMKLKAVITDFPSLMHDASEAIAEAMIGLKEWNEEFGRNMHGEFAQIQMGRGGQGSMGGQFRKVMPEFNAKLLQDKGGSAAMIGAWSDAEFERGKALGELTLKEINKGLENAAHDRIFGDGKKGKKGKFEWGAELQNELVKAGALASNMRGGGDTRDFAAGLTESRGVMMQRKGSDTRDVGSNQRELDNVLRLTEAERAREEQRVDYFGTQQVDFGAELERLNTEREAKLAFWDEEAANATTRLELLDIQEARKQEIHEAELARIDTERAAREQEQARMQQYISAGAQAAQQVVGGLVSITDARWQARQAALAQGKTEAQAARAAKIATLEATAGQLQALRNLAISKAIEQTALGLGALGTTWGIPNPAAMLHFASAATWAVVGVGAGLGARGVSSAASGMRREDAAAGAVSGGSGPAGGRGSGTPGGGGGGRPGNDSPIPGSPGPQAPRSGNMPAPGGAARREVHLNGPIYLLGAPTRELGRQLDEMLEQAAHDRRPRRAAGGG